MRKISVLLFSVSCFVGVQAQSSDDLWYEATLVMEAGDTLRGELSYNLETNTVVIKTNTNVFTGSPRTVVAFEIFDTELDDYRKFYSLPSSTGGYYNVPTFFELLADGKITLLCRDHLETRTVGYGYYTYGYSVNVIVSEYYILNQAGKLEPLIDNKKNWWLLMSRYRDKVEDYMAEHKLKLDSKYDIKKIINYYNSLF